MKNTTNLQKEKELRGFLISDDISFEDLAHNGSVIPAIIESEMGTISEIIIADAMSGGANYKNNMPVSVTLTRITSTGEKYTCNYLQNDD